MHHHSNQLIIAFPKQRKPLPPTIFTLYHCIQKPRIYISVAVNLCNESKSRLSQRQSLTAIQSLMNICARFLVLPTSLVQGILVLTWSSTAKHWAACACACVPTLRESRRDWWRRAIHETMDGTCSLHDLLVSGIIITPII